MDIVKVEDGVVTLTIALDSEPETIVRTGKTKKGPWKGAFTRLTEMCYRSRMCHPDINDGKEFQATVDFTQAKFD
tara:strand:+ start:432 stop:656 length:225 start_codon:yes stop_codon:yes gene_type:complete